MKKFNNINEFASAVKEALNEDIKRGYSNIPQRNGFDTDKYHSYTIEFPKMGGIEPVVATFKYTSWDSPEELLDLEDVEIHQGNLADLITNIVKETGGNLTEYIKHRIWQDRDNESENDVE